MQLTNENYFSKEAEQFYMGSTQFKRFLECESSALAHINGEIIEEKSTALLVGSFVDAYFSGELPLFKAQNPDICKKDGSLKADYLQAEEIIRRIERDPEFMKALSGQKQVIMTGVIAGVPFKIKVDSLLPDRIVDQKVMRDMADVYSPEEGRRVPFWKFWGYDVQGAIYREVVRQNTGLLLPFGLAVATKEKETDIDLIQLPPSVLDDALALVEEQAPYFDMIKKDMEMPDRCGKCDYCRNTKVLKGWRMAEIC
jgi:hypothetical protein